MFVGDLIGTLADSTMGLTLGAATQVRLGPEARLTIDRFILKAGGVLVLENGGMLVDHATAAGGIDLKVRSRFGLIAIRGTRFFAGPSNGAFGVFVQRGAVEVEGGSARVRLEAGMGTSIATPGAAPGAAVVWSAARIAAALALVGAG